MGEIDDRARRAEELLRERTHMVGQGAQEARSADQDLQERIAELTRDLQRERADFANYRRRNEAERGEFARFAKTELITKLLEIRDAFDRALETVPGELRSQPWVDGIWLVERKLRDILASEGLEEIDSVGKTFDPYVHEAIAHVESTEPEGTVVDEVRKAYKLHDRIIRPALVTVAKALSGDVPPGAQTEARSDEVEHPGPERGVPPSQGRGEVKE